MPSNKKRKNKAPQANRPAEAQNVSAEPLDEAAATARREQQRREWALQKRAKERKPIPVALYAWLGGGGLAIAGVFILIFVVLSGGDSDSTPAVSATPDPRVAGEPIAQTVEISATDQGQNVNPRFSVTTIVGRAGEVIEIRMTNNGTVAHNLAVAGEDGEYGTRDDWITNPESVKAGEVGVVRVKIDTPGTYDYQCDFHPQAQVGQIVLS